MKCKIICLLFIIVFCVIVGNVYNENMSNNIKLIGITVSYNYMDTLKYVLPIDQKHFDKLYIVTQKDDLNTINFCNKYNNVELVYFDFKENGKIFNKGGGLKKAQEIAHKKYPNHWYLIFDSDIIFPENFKSILNSTDLDPNELYECNRCIITDTNSLQKCKDSKPLNIKNKGNDTDRDIDPGSACGFFQLYNKTNILYEDSIDAGQTDLDFKNRFYNKPDNYQRSKILKNLFVYHLGSDGKNWKEKVIEFNDTNISLNDLKFNI